MPEKIEIIYDFNGYLDPEIKNVEVSRVNGYKTVITKEGEEKMVYQLKNITEVDVAKIIECADFKGIDIEEIIKSINKLKEVKIKMTEKTDDEIRFTEEEKKVNAFLEKNPKMSYREAVETVLDRTEPLVKEEFIEKRRKQGIEVNYREAVLKVLDRSESEPKEE